MSKVEIRRLGFGVILVLALASGCKKEDPGTSAGPSSSAAQGKQETPQERQLQVFVPCSIFGPFCNVLDQYKAANPGVKIEFDSGNSVVHKRTVLHKGARPDVYMGTGPLETDPLVEAGLVLDGSMRQISTDTVLLTVPRGNRADVRSVEDLFREGVRMIAIPDPRINSSGKFAIEAFKKLGAWEKIKDKVVYTELGRTARKYVMDGKVDAGIMYRSCLYEELQPGDEILAPGDIVTMVDLLAQAQLPEIATPGCVLKASANPELAQDFLDYLASAASQKLFEQWRVVSGETVTSGAVRPRDVPPKEVEAPAPIKSNKQVLLQAYYPFNEEHQFIADYVQSLPGKYGDSVKVEIIDFRKEEGYEKWRASGLTCGGILFNGKYSVNIDMGGEVKNVRLLRRPGMGWEKAELEAAIVQALKGTKPAD